MRAQLRVKLHVDDAQTHWVIQEDSRNPNFLAAVLRAQQRGWRLAARRFGRDLRAVLDRLHADLAVIAQALDDNDRSHRPTATIQDIYHDVLALHDEFEKVSWDHPQQTLSATTEPIELEGVYLGEFEIRLDWGDLVDGHPSNYRVIAVDAHPASSNDDVTTTTPPLVPCSSTGGVCVSPRSKILSRLFSLSFVATAVRAGCSRYNSMSTYNGVKLPRVISCIEVRRVVVRGARGHSMCVVGAVCAIRNTGRCDMLTTPWC